MRNKLPAATFFALACSIVAAQTAEPVCTMSFLKGSVTESGNRPVTVFYVTDGARLGPAVDGVCRLLSGTKGSKTECATVAVDVPERTAFLTPTASSLGRSGLETGGPPAGGRAAELVECLEKIVKPEVKRRLEGRAVTHVLMGHSFGGLFALSTMASRPELFRPGWPPIRRSGGTAACSFECWRTNRLRGTPAPSSTRASALP